MNRPFTYRASLRVMARGSRAGALLAFAVALFPALGIAQSSTSVATTGVGGAAANSNSGAPSISADGRWVAFDSYASNLVPGDNNGTSDVFFHDRLNGTTTRVSVSSSGTDANSYSFQPSVSADGSRIAFWSSAQNLVQGDTNGVEDVFVRDRVSGETRRVSVATGGSQGNSHSMAPAISANGRFVAFWSTATNLVPGDTNAAADVFVHDLLSSQTAIVSIGAGGQGDFDSGPAPGRLRDGPSISADGRWIAFQSSATNLVAGDHNSSRDVFLHDRQTGATTRVSDRLGGADADQDSMVPSISADGRWIAFISYATNLVVGDTNGWWDVFLYDRVAEHVTRISVGPGGVQSDGASTERPSLSADGRWIAFYSHASNFVFSDTNFSPDIFVHDRVSSTMIRASLGPGDVQAQGYTHALPSISADGRFVAFDSTATNFVAGANNGVRNIFIRDVAERGCPLVVSPPSLDLPAAGGTGQVSVLATYTCSWAAASNDSEWLTVTGGNTGAGSGTVSVSATANPLSAPRVGTVSIGGAELQVSQGLGPPGTPSSPNPPSGSALTTSPSILDWADASNASSYSVYVDGVLRASVTASQWPVSPLLTGGSHVWRVVALNAAGSSSSADWRLHVGDSRLDFVASRGAAPLTETTPVFVRRVDEPGSPILLTEPAWIVVHGRSNTSSADEIVALMSAIIAARPSREQVLVLDWATGALASNDFDFSGEDWIKPVGTAAAEALARYGLVGERVTLIGHSWGANVVDELAERLPFSSGPNSPTGVHAIVALDAARDAFPLGGAYNAELGGEVSFASHSTCSWAFRSSRLGSAVTPATADEAFSIALGLPEGAAEAAHRLATTVFTNLALTPNGRAGRHFRLDRLANCQPGPWAVNRFDGEGYRLAGAQFEGVVLALDGIPSEVDYDGSTPTNLRVLSMSGNTVRLGLTLPVLGAAVTAVQLEGGFAPGQIVGAVSLPALPEVTLTLPAGSFYLRVRAASGAGLSEPSNEVMVRVSGSTTPSPPAGLLGLANGSSLALAWRNTFTGGVPTLNTLHVSGPVNASLPLGLAETFQFGSVPPGSYTFTVTASNGNGQSAPSGAVTLAFPATCEGVPAPVANFVAFRSGSTLTLSWDPAPHGSAPTGYLIGVSGAFTGSVPIAARSLSATVPAGTYRFTVSATNSCGASAATPAQTVVIR